MDECDILIIDTLNYYGKARFPDVMGSLVSFVFMKKNRWQLSSIQIIPTFVPKLKQKDVEENRVLHNYTELYALILCLEKSAKFDEKNKQAKGSRRLGVGCFAYLHQGVCRCLQDG